MYDQDYGYAATRLAGTYVSHNNGKVVQIHDVSIRGVVNFYYLDNPDIKTCHLDEINCSPLRLGYAETPIGAMYISRIPSRRYRQGLTAQSVCCKMGGVVVGNGNFTPKALMSCVESRFKPFKGVLAILTRKTKEPVNPFSQTLMRPLVSLPWNRKWALNKNMKVEYKGGFVGKVVDGVVILDKKFKYLQEELEESL